MVFAHPLPTAPSIRVVGKDVGASVVGTDVGF